MATVIRVSAKEKPRKALKALKKETKLQKKEKKKLSDFYGKMQGLYGDGLAYQKKIRNEW